MGRQKSTNEFWWEAVSALTLTWARYKREDLGWGWESGDSAAFQHPRTPPSGGGAGGGGEWGPGTGNFQVWMMFRVQW